VKGGSVVVSSESFGAAGLKEVIAIIEGTPACFPQLKKMRGGCIRVARGGRLRNKGRGRCIRRAVGLRCWPEDGGSDIKIAPKRLADRYFLFVPGAGGQSGTR